MKIVFHHCIRSEDGQFIHIDELIRALRPTARVLYGSAK
jgi:hypothetical protein